MIVHVEQFNGRFWDQNTFAAAYGFEELGAEVRFFNRPLLPKDITRDTPVVGSIQTVHAALRKIGVPVPVPLDYPDELGFLLKRHVRRTTFGELRRANFRGFIKPVAHKKFTGQVFVSYYNTEAIPDDEPVWASEAVEFLSEYRCFVLFSEVLDVRLYRGSWRHAVNPWAVENAVRQYRDRPVAFSLDVGVLKDGGTALVEVNDAYALGAYGLSPVKYAEMITARWAELCHLPDDVASPSLPCKPDPG